MNIWESDDCGTVNRTPKCFGLYVIIFIKIFKIDYLFANAHLKTYKWFQCWFPYLSKLMPFSLRFTCTFNKYRARFVAKELKVKMHRRPRSGVCECEPLRAVLINEGRRHRADTHHGVQFSRKFCFICLRVKICLIYFWQLVCQTLDMSRFPKGSWIL